MYKQFNIGLDKPLNFELSSHTVIKPLFLNRYKVKDMVSVYKNGINLCNARIELLEIIVLSELTEFQAILAYDMSASECKEFLRLKYRVADIAEYLIGIYHLEKVHS
jgi:hypothetical protein